MDAMIWCAGVVQLCIAAANFFAPRKFGYRENLARVSPLVRHVFVVHSVYIVLVVVMFAALCGLFAPDLAGASPLGRFLSGCLALFWGLRLVIQLAVYDRAVRRQNRAVDLLFIAAFVYLTGVFGAAYGFPCAP